MKKPKLNLLLLFPLGLLWFYLFGTLMWGKTFAHLIVVGGEGFTIKDWLEYEHNDLYYVVSTIIITAVIVFYFIRLRRTRFAHSNNSVTDLKSS